MKLTKQCLQHIKKAIQGKLTSGEFTGNINQLAETAHLAWSEYNLKNSETNKDVIRLSNMSYEKLADYRKEDFVNLVIRLSDTIMGPGERDLSRAKVVKGEVIGSRPYSPPVENTSIVPFVPKPTTTPTPTPSSESSTPTVPILDKAQKKALEREKEDAIRAHIPKVNDLRTKVKNFRSANDEKSARELETQIETLVKEHKENMSKIEEKHYSSATTPSVTPAPETSAPSTKHSREEIINNILQHKKDLEHFRKVRQDHLNIGDKGKAAVAHSTIQSLKKSHIEYLKEQGVYDDLVKAVKPKEVNPNTNVFRYSGKDKFIPKDSHTLLNPDNEDHQVYKDPQGKYHVVSKGDKKLGDQETKALLLPIFKEEKQKQLNKPLVNRLPYDKEATNSHVAILNKKYGHALEHDDSSHQELQGKIEKALRSVKIPDSIRVKPSEKNKFLSQVRNQVIEQDYLHGIIEDLGLKGEKIHVPTLNSSGQPSHKEIAAEDFVKLAMTRKWQGKDVKLNPGQLVRWLKNNATNLAEERRPPVKPSLLQRAKKGVSSPVKWIQHQIKRAKKTLEEGNI